MSSFLSQIQNKQGPQILALSVPWEISRQRDDIRGELFLSRQGYVYAKASRSVLWMKFLGLALALPFVGIAHKCKELAFRCFGKEVPSKGYYDFKYVMHLANIALKAVFGWNKVSLVERVEQFALTEIDYNNKDRLKELNMVRSHRLLQGMYVAKCMQPLFHQSQFTSPLSLRQKLSELGGVKIQLEKSLHTERVNQQNVGWLGSLVNSLFSENDPYLEWSKEDILLELAAIDKQKTALNKLLVQAERCQKYAAQAILSQQPKCHHKGECCSGVECSLTGRDCAPVHTTEQVDFCGEPCYRHQQICGIVHKIDCCATRCWALDCCGFFCCFWPEGRSCCVI